MKGQYRVIIEILLFGVGVAITSFVLISFSSVQENTSSISIEDQLDTVINLVINGIIKASLTENSTIRIEIPETISGHTYKLYIENNKNITGIDMNDPRIKISKSIYNINESVLIEGEIVSSARLIEISYDGSKIIIQRG